MIKRAKSKAVDGKTAPADGARNFRKDVKGGLCTLANAQDPGLGLGRAQEPNRLLPAFGHGEVIVARMEVFGQPGFDGFETQLLKD